MLFRSWLAREFNTMADSVTGLVGEVRSQRERLETVINSIDDGIVVLDGERNIIAANDALKLRPVMRGGPCQNVRRAPDDSSDQIPSLGGRMAAAFEQSCTLLAAPESSGIIPD